MKTSTLGEVLKGKAIKDALGLWAKRDNSDHVRDELTHTLVNTRSHSLVRPFLQAWFYQCLLHDDFDLIGQTVSIPNAPSEAWHDSGAENALRSLSETLVDFIGKHPLIQDQEAFFRKLKTSVECSQDKDPLQTLATYTVREMAKTWQTSGQPGNAIFISHMVKALDYEYGLEKCFQNIDLDENGFDMIEVLAGHQENPTTFKSSFMKSRGRFAIHPGQISHPDTVEKALNMQLESSINLPDFDDFMQSVARFLSTTYPEVGGRGNGQNSAIDAILAMAEEKWKKKSLEKQVSPAVNPSMPTL